MHPEIHIEAYSIAILYFVKYARKILVVEFKESIRRGEEISIQNGVNLRILG